MAFVQCTKYTPRVETPVSLGPRFAGRTSLRRRADVEGTTSGKVLWGSMQAREGQQTQPKVWTTSHKVDYPTRKGDTVAPQVVRERSIHMRTESIRLGDDRQPMQKVVMQKLPREHYVGRLLHRRGAPSHSKTKSELFVCPAEVEEWRTRHLKAMSHRQFSGEVTTASAANAGSRKAIQRDMLASHFDVGFAACTGGNNWVTQSQAEFSMGPGQRADKAMTPTACHTPCPPPSKAKGTASSLALDDPNWKADTHTTSSSLYGSRVRQRPSTALHPREPQKSVSGIRAALHGKHSWELGYEKGPKSRYITEQKLSFTPVNFEHEAAAETARAHRRDSVQRMVHMSSVPI